MTSKVNVKYNSSSSEDEADSEYSDDHSPGGESSSEDDPKKKTAAKRKKKPANEAVVDVMAKILGKTLPEKKSTILCKGITDKALERKRNKNDNQEDDTEEVKVKKEPSDSEDSEDGTPLDPAQKQKRRLWENMGRCKPDVLDREKERQLQRIATKGVVQLFNAVKKQQKLVDDKLKEVGSSVHKQDKVMQTMTKGKFMDVLKGTTSNVSAQPVTKKIKTEKNLSDVKIKEEKEDHSWSILRDDFMMGAKMKDWDKESDGSDGEGNKNDNMSDSDMDT